MLCRLFSSLFIALSVTLSAEVAGTTSLSELLAVQRQVQELLPNVRPAVVAIQTFDGSASGVIITKDGLILTAAHVAEKPGREMRVVLENGKVMKATTLGLDKTADAALMQLNDNETTWPYVQVSREVVKTEPGVWCFALGHPGGYDKERGVVLRVGKIVKKTANSLQSDCVLMGGDSGGPLLNLRGQVIGIHSQIWEERDQNMHVSMAPFFRSWEDLKSSQVIQVWGTGSGGFLGVNLGPMEASKITVMQIQSFSAAEKAGIHVGDVISALDSEAMLSVGQFLNAVRSRPAGTEIMLTVLRGRETKNLKVTLGHFTKEDA